MNIKIYCINKELINVKRGFMRIIKLLLMLWVLFLFSCGNSSNEIEFVQIFQTTTYIMRQI